ncbi:non-ribosomal peptide synthetase, partial [Gorillibacterium massiliense]|uniref:non-ribosomal peptide synthetase n=1 Tax=Gorillibacterium massiliense TaxID=1280390 RepID=UPI0005924F79
IKGELDEALFEEALQRVVRRHEALRTVFIEGEDGPRQMVLKETVVRLAVEDVRELAEEERHAYVQEQIRQSEQVPFDLGQGPLMRAKLYRLDEQTFRLYACLHHIVTDGWSMQRLQREWMDTYGKLLRNEATDGEAPKLRYVDYAEWQTRELTEGRWSAEEAYWLETLAKPLPNLDLPLDYVRPETQTYAGDTVKLEIPRESAKRLKELAKREDMSLFMVLLTAYLIVLHRLTQQEDLVVGTPIAGRMNRSLEEVLGFFANTLAIRVKLAGNQTVKELLQAVKAQCLGAYEHQAYPFDMLIEKLNPERSLSQSPVFSTMFDYMKNENATDDFVIDWGKAEFYTSKFDLQLSFVEERDSDLYGLFIYNTDLFKQETVKRFAELYELAVEAVLGSTEATVGGIELLSAKDRDVYRRMNDTQVDYPLDQTMLDAFIRQAEDHPERKAATCEGQSLTYGELHESSNRLAHLLRREGVKPNQLVAVMMERGLDLLVALYGVLKAGAAYVPIDPEYPDKRIQYMISDSEANAVITKSAYLPSFIRPMDGVENPSKLAAIVLMENDGGQRIPEGIRLYTKNDLASMPPETPQGVNRPEDLAYMIYTSGSTGNPKGVLTCHKAIVNRLLWHQDTFRAQPNDVILQRTTVCFDDSIIELFWPLRHGACMSIVMKDMVADSYRLLAHIRRERISYLQFVPSLFGLLLGAMQDMPAAEWADIPVRTIIVSGEPLPVSYVNQWFDMIPQGTRIANLYGATEAAVDTTAFIMENKPTGIHVGCPMANNQVYIVNPQGALCPIHVKGEIYLGGVNLAEGYRNNAEKTAKSFVMHKLPGAPVQRLYRTGDYGRLLPDGNIEFIGRIDNQVKVRGYRIELGEIEENLVLHPEISAAVVVAVKGADGNSALCGFYTSAGGNLDVGEIKAFLKMSLPDYMVPYRLIRLDHLPLTPNGKADRLELEKQARESAADRT